MLLSKVNELCKKGAAFAIKALPIILPIILIANTNATASTMNGQPTPPESIKKYRKF